MLLEALFFMNKRKGWKGITTMRSESQAPHPGMSFKEFVGLMAAMMAVGALAIDSMLPAMQQIGAALGVASANERQWIITAYMLGFGAAQIVYGTLADRYGRKPILLCGLAGYVVGSLLVGFSRSFELVLLARGLQGVAASATRVIVVSVVRDCYAGRMMARVMSLAFIVFLGVPILAPSIGQLIMLVGPWRWIFIGLAMFGAAVFLWVALRLPETLHEDDQAPIEFFKVAEAFRVVLSNRISVGYTLAMTLIFGGLVGFLNSAQQVFIDVFKEPRLFAVIFAGIAASIAVASLVNARLVDRLGMRLLSHGALLGFIAVAGIHAVVALSGFETLWTFLILQAAMMFCFGLLVGNFGAIAMEPLGHVAGTAASVQGFVSTIGGALIGFMIGQSFNGTDVPLTLGFTVCGGSALAVVLITERGKLFTNQQVLVEAA
jgi:DHA1 family bicyclomycin/chloramphenicol resistance-like MFS transporter